jgi:hypothetical protein
MFHGALEGFFILFFELQDFCQFFPKIIEFATKKFKIFATS